MILDLRRHGIGQLYAMSVILHSGSSISSGGSRGGSGSSSGRFVLASGLKGLPTTPFVQPVVNQHSHVPGPHLELCSPPKRDGAAPGIK